jgi:metal-responsive CopG/Arc/MetJ family transcriptional regulator
MSTFSLKLPESLQRRLEAQARDRGVSQSSLVREAIERYLEEGRRGAGESFGELAADLEGTVEGPVDLSTNPDHLRDFGR